MNEDFTEEEFEDELPEGVEFAEPAPAQPAAPQARPAPQPKRRRAATSEPQPTAAPVTPAATEALKERYTPFMMPKRIGVLDNETQQPLMEDQDTNTLLLGLITKLLNDVEDIKKNL